MSYEIYLFTNLKNNKKYVGQTKSDRLSRRIQEHIMDILYTKTTYIFHAALAKYGLENFKVEVLESNIPESLIDEREQYYIKQYNTYYKNNYGYNMTYGGQGTHGYIFTDADKLKMSKKQKQYWADLKDKNKEEYQRLCKLRSDANKGKPKSDSTRKKLQAAHLGKSPWNKGLVGVQASKAKNTSTLPNILMYKLDSGELLNSFVNSTSAAEFIVADTKKIATISTRIFSVCKANKGIAYGYIWRFADKPLVLDDIDLTKLTKSSRAKTVVQYDLTRVKLAEYESAAQYSKTISDDYKLQRRIARGINSCCAGYSKTYKGFIWKYLN